MEDPINMSSNLIPLPMVTSDDHLLTSFEQNFDVAYWRNWFHQHWSISAYLSAVYIVLVFGGAFLMKNRKPFKLNGILTVWNIGLSIMSIWAFCRFAPEFFQHFFGENGLYHTSCEWTFHTRAAAFWGFVIMVSKVVEFGDTAFVVLRKQDLKFIHYYHHVVTAVSWWYMYPYYEPIQMWYVVMNSFVHSLMYPYYAIRAMKIPVPKVFAMIITGFQLAQMFLGVYVNLYTVWLMYIVGTPADCPQRSGTGVLICLSIYSFFVFLFGKFFVDSYLGKGTVKSKKG